MMNRRTTETGLLKRISDEGQHLFGIRRVTPAVIERLLARYGLALMRAEFSVLWAISPRHQGKRWIMLREGLPFALDRVLVVRTLICAAAPLEAHDEPRAATVAALATLLCARDVERSNGRFLARKRHFLADERADRLWGEWGLDALLDDAGEAVRQIQRGRGWEAYRKGRAARDAPDFKRAAVWFRRAVRCARHAGDTRLEVLALVGLGKVYGFTADYPRARSRLLVAAKIARRDGHRTAFAYAAHELTAVAVETRDTCSVSRYGRAAFRAYEDGDESRLALAGDVAGSWVLSGDFRRACQVLATVAPRTPVPHKRLAFFSLLARAAGCCGDATTYREAEGVVLAAGAAAVLPLFVAQAFFNLGWGALGAGNTEAARAYASRALALAEEQGAATLGAAIRDLLGALAVGSVVHWIPRTPDEAADAFAAEVVGHYEREGGAPPSRS